MRPLRFGLVGLSAVLAVLVLLQHFGVDFGACDYGCRAIMSNPISPVLTFAAPLAVGLQAYLLFSDKFRMLLWLTVLLAASSVATFAYMVSLEQGCSLCVALSFSFWATLISLAPGRWLGFCSLGVVCLAGWTLFDHYTVQLRRRTVVQFERRPYEPPPYFGDERLVLFVDPACEKCRELEIRISQNVAPDSVLVRWYLLPQFAPGSLRAATVIETISELNAELGRRLRTQIARSNNKLTNETLIAIGRSLGVEEQVRRALAVPDPSILKRIARDGKIAEELRVSQVPSAFHCLSSGLGELRDHLTPIEVARAHDGSWQSVEILHRPSLSRNSPNGGRSK